MAALAAFVVTTQAGAASDNLPDESNNSTWVDIQLGAPGQPSCVLGWGPNA